MKLGKNGEQFNLEQAFEEFKKQAGLDIPLRGGKGITQIITISSRGEELPLRAWLQLFQDEGQGTFYVREYGLLIADKKSAPPDALTLIEFWKQKPPATESKAESKKWPLFVLLCTRSGATQCTLVRQNEGHFLWQLQALAR